MPVPIALMEKAEHILRDVFGFSSFRNGQRDIISAVLSGTDVVGVLPTGGGKSLCYQVPALVFPNMTLVVSPLIALMKDQTERLRDRGVQAWAIHGGISQGEVNDIIFRASQGGVKLLYVAPERLESATFRRQLHSIPLSLLAVDEAHCISEWGHDFRPSYRNILSVFDSRQRVPIIALTATATPDVRADVSSALQLKNPVEIVRGFSRPNLSFRVVVTAAKVEFVTQQARMHQGAPIIVYAGSRRRVETMNTELSKRGIASAGYHGGMPTHQRSATQDAFLNDQVQVLVATNAFGMGIDKPDVRHVVHSDLTLTLEAYYQEAGRAGRDGNPAVCTLLYQSEDKRLMNFYIESTYPDRTQIADVYEYLCSRAGILKGQATQTPIMADSASIASALHKTQPSIDGVLSLLHRSGVTMSVSPHGSASVKLRTSHERLDQFTQAAPPEYRSALQLIARVLHGKSMGQDVALPVVELLRRSDVTAAEMARALQAVQLAQLVHYTSQNAGGGILLMHERMDASQIPIDYDAMRLRRERATQKLDVMVGYAESRQCKRNFILSYFGDSGAHGTCGQCSSCTTSPDRNASVSERMMENIDAIMQATWQVRGSFGRHVVVDIVRGVYSQKIQEHNLDRCVAWTRLPHRSKAELLESIDVALNQGWLVKSADLYPTIGVASEGVALMTSVPKQLALRRKDAPTQSPTAVLSSARMERLLALRERIAAQRGVAPDILCSLTELEAIAQDGPRGLQDFLPGRHGSSMFIAQYADQIIACVETSTASHRAAASEHVAQDVRDVVDALSYHTTLDGLSEECRKSKASLAAILQQAIESGMDVQRGNLIDEQLYGVVLEYMRFHRFAKLRDVRDHVGGEPSMPELRLAVAFARRDLFSPSNQIS